MTNIPKSSKLVLFISSEILFIKSIKGWVLDNNDGDNLLDCPGDEAFLSANVSGGVGSLLGSENINEPYTYLWSNLGSDQ